MCLKNLRFLFLLTPSCCGSKSRKRDVCYLADQDSQVLFLKRHTRAIVTFRLGHNFFCQTSLRNLVTFFKIRLILPVRSSLLSGADTNTWPLLARLLFFSLFSSFTLVRYQSSHFFSHLKCLIKKGQKKNQSLQY